MARGSVSPSSVSRGHLHEPHVSASSALCVHSFPSYQHASHGRLGHTLMTSSDFSISTKILFLNEVTFTVGVRISTLSFDRETVQSITCSLTRTDKKWRWDSCPTGQPLALPCWKDVIQPQKPKTTALITLETSDSSRLVRRQMSSRRPHFGASVLTCVNHGLQNLSVLLPQSSINVSHYNCDSPLGHLDTGWRGWLGLVFWMISAKPGFG